MKAKFTMAGVNQYIQSQTQAYEEAIINALHYAGDEFIENAEANRTFGDRTGNLLASIGYLILKDGQEIFSSFPGDYPEGVNNAKKAAAEVAANHNRGFVLIGVAGMSYAAAVESMGYDVITGSAPSSEKIRDLLKSIKIKQ